MRRIVIHAGFHKTGTTTVQQTLKAHATVLAPHLQVVLREDMEAVCEAARAYSLAPDEGLLAQFETQLDAWLAGLEPLDPRPLCVSSEDLSGHMPGRHEVKSYCAAPALMAAMARGVKRRYPAADLCFYFSTREAQSWLASCHWQNLRVTRLCEDLASYSRTMAVSADLDAIIGQVRAAVAPHPVEHKALDQMLGDNGLMEPLYGLLGLPSKTYAQLSQVDAVNVRADPQLIRQLLALNRSRLPLPRLRQRKYELITQSRRNRASSKPGLPAKPVRAARGPGRAANDRVAIVSTVRAPAEQLLAFVNFHVNQGVDCVCLYFDDPDDAAVDLLATHPAVHLQRCDASWWAQLGGARPENIEARQVSNVNHAAAGLAGAGFAWLIHIDSDELVYPLRGLKVLLGECQADALGFEVMEAVSEQLSYAHIFQPTLFRSMAHPAQLQHAATRGVTQALLGGEYFRGHTGSKMAVRIGPHIEQYHIHRARARGRPLQVQASRDVQLLHYDCVDFASWDTKWARRLSGAATAAQMRSNRNHQLELYREACAQGEEALKALFQRLHGIPDQERAVLQSLGLLHRIELDAALFAPPTGLPAQP